MAFDVVNAVKRVVPKNPCDRLILEGAVEEIELLREALAYADSKMWRKYVDDDGRPWSQSPEREPVRLALKKEGRE